MAATRTDPRASAAAGPAAPDERAVEAFGLRRCWADTPTAIRLLVVLHGLLLTLYAVLVPTYQAPDEPQHVDLVRAVGSGLGWPEHGQRMVSEQIVRSLPLVGFAGRLPDGLRADDALPLGERPTLDELGPDQPSTQLNPLTQHPPLYYTTASLFLTTVTTLAPGGGELAFDQLVGVIRVWSVLLTAPLVLYAHHAALRIGRDRRAAALAAVLPLGIPQLTHIGSVANNDVLLVALMGALTVPLAYAATGDTSRRTALWAGGLAGLALLTKGLAVIALAWIPAAYALALLRHRADSPRVLGSGALAVGVTLGIGGWWWVRNLVRFGRLFPLGENLPGAPDTFVPDLVLWADRWTGAMRHTFWGYFGWLDTPIPRPAVAVATLVVAGGLALALLLRPRAAVWSRLDLALLLVPIGGLAALLAWRSWSDYQQVADLPGLQGRYLFAGVVGLCAAVALGYGVVRLPGLLPAALALVTAMQLFAVAVLLGRYWEPGVAPAARAVLAWSPFGPALPIALLVAITATCTAFLALRPAQKPPPTSAQ